MITYILKLSKILYSEKGEDFKEENNISKFWRKQTQIGFMWR